MRPSLLRRSLLAVALIALLPVPIVRAADIQPVLTMDPIPSSIYRGQWTLFNGHITGEPSGQVLVESSTDGVTWQWVNSANINISFGSWSTSEPTLDGNTPLGTRYIRAHYPGAPGYLEAFSAVQSQNVLIRQATISNFHVFNPNQNVIVPGTDPVRVYAQATDGAMTLERYVNDAWTVIAGPMGGSLWTDIGALGEGDTKFRANIEATDYNLGAVQELTVHVEKGATEPVWFGDLSVQANHALPAQVSINGFSGGPSMDGPMTVKDVASDTVIASGMVGLQFTIPPMAAGTHQFLVSYLGTADYAASTKTFDVVVTNDVAEATGLGTNYTTFYPYKDGYRDTVTIRGNRLEPLSVWIRIYSPTGSLVKSVTLARAAGPYGYVWNGRTSSGALRSAGKYKIVQVLADAAGARKSFTSYVTLSHKKLVTKTVYVTKLGSSITVKGDSGTGSIVISTSGGYAKLTGHYPGGWVGVGYQFTLPSAPVYKSIAFQVYSKGPLNTQPSAIGLQNFINCPYSSSGDWYAGCFDHWKNIGSTSSSPVWYSTSGSVTANRYGRTVRGLVSVNAFTQTIYKARVKVVYGVLQ